MSEEIYSNRRFVACRCMLPFVGSIGMFLIFVGSVGIILMFLGLPQPVKSSRMSLENSSTFLLGVLLFFIMIAGNIFIKRLLHCHDMSSIEDSDVPQERAPEAWHESSQETMKDVPPCYEELLKTHAISASYLSALPERPPRYEDVVGSSYPYGADMIGVCGTSQCRGELIMHGGGGGGGGESSSSSSVMHHPLSAVGAAALPHSPQASSVVTTEELHGNELSHGRVDGELSQGMGGELSQGVDGELSQGRVGGESALLRVASEDPVCR